ncbi:MAG TPA: DEAD/DEAH box helicase [Burkholderiales bacterium]|nr:DEAD/DEAH box helicase [Burkholderiales bacterium]
MLPSDFHPVLQRWWENRFADTTDGARHVLAPTEAQLEGWQAIRQGRDTLIAAPTGSGKTLAAFLTAIDELFREGLASGELPDEVRVIYVSPLKALSADIHKNLAEPRREIRRLAEDIGYAPVRITAAVRSGDTPQAERAAMLRTPPNILVTTPESLYLLLTAEKSREMLKTARVVIVDEIHAVLESRRGAHLALSLERLEHACGRKLQRIGLSATQKPIEEVARFLSGTDRRAAGCAIVDRGHKRKIDLAVEVPGSPLEAVMSAEVWKEIYARLLELIEAHRTTLIMVNTRRLAERMAHQLTELLGAEHVAAHHGSLSKEKRLDAEERLRNGQLKVLVSTASLELGIDIGHVDLVCQISSPNRIATLLQRVGRSGHTVRGLPKGRVFPLTRDDLVECAAMVRAVKDGELDRVTVPDKPLDVLAQQIVAESAAEEWDETALFDLMRGAHPYRDLTREEYGDVLEMLSQGYTTKRGRRAALIHHDAVNEKVRARKGSRMTAIMCGGAIPEVFDYRVLLEPEGTFIGTLNEDFAIESLPGDIFQLGNTSWRILRIQSGVVRVADAQGQPPSMPFWLGEAPSRSNEVSAAVSRLRAGADARLPGPDEPRKAGDTDAAADWIEQHYALSRAAAEQIAEYIAEGKRCLGIVPTVDRIALERFFDESGGMQLVLHAPFGSRVNRAWGLALRKKFCQGFNLELQAAATDEGVIISLGPSHSFPLDEPFRYLHPNTVRETLIQAVLTSPIFEARWRWTTTLALAVPRSRNGARVPAQIQRMYAEDLLQGVFPEAAACLDNIQGAREIPDHPLVNQAIRDALEEAMDLPQLISILERMARGEIECHARETPEPSVFSHELVNSAVYTFLDDAPLEERRTHAVYTRRATEPRSADDLGALDPAAIQRVREEAWPYANTADELHDALLLAGFIREDEVAPQPNRLAASGQRETVGWPVLMDELVAAGRAVRTGPFWVPVERFDELSAVVPQSSAPAIPERLRKQWTQEDAARELIRGRMEVLGPVTAAALATSFRGRGAGGTVGCVDDAPRCATSAPYESGLPRHEDVAQLVDSALLALETEGRAMRGYFTPGTSELEWCDRRLLARIHRYTISRLRAEIEPVSSAEFMRFLLHWQHVAAEQQVSGVEGLAAVVEQLDGYELGAAAWEHDVLPARVRDYTSGYIDMLCLSGRVAWGRVTPMDGGKAPLKSSPIALMLREHAPLWRVSAPLDTEALTSAGRAVYEALRARGALFFHELVAATGLLRTHVERALGELAGVGVVTADSFSGLRALLTPSEKRKSLSGGRPGSRRSAYGVDTAGRWALLTGEDGVHPFPEPPPSTGREAEEERVEAIARILLKRYGVVFRALLARESRLPTWRELVMVYRRLEARGEIRGGRFVGGFGGEQFALPEAVGRLRAVRKLEKSGELAIVSAADPLNLVGIVTPDARVTAIAQNRILFRDGTAVAAREAGEVRRLAESDMHEEELRALLSRRASVKALKPHFRTPTEREREMLARKRERSVSGEAEELKLH